MEGNKSVGSRIGVSGLSEPSPRISSGLTLSATSRSSIHVCFPSPLLGNLEFVVMRLRRKWNELLEDWNGSYIGQGKFIHLGEEGCVTLI